MAAKIPPRSTLTPYLSLKDTSAAIAFYKKAFGAKERFRLTDPSGKIGHAEITTRTKQVSPEEMQRLWSEALAGG